VQSQKFWWHASDEVAGMKVVRMKLMPACSVEACHQSSNYRLEKWPAGQRAFLKSRKQRHCLPGHFCLTTGALLFPNQLANDSPI
jgi:hypothetical protein